MSNGKGKLGGKSCFPIFVTQGVVDVKWSGKDVLQDMCQL